MSAALSFIGNMLGQIMAIQLPWGISFGVLIVGLAFFPIMFKAFKTILENINITAMSGEREKSSRKDMQRRNADYVARRNYERLSR